MLSERCRWDDRVGITSRSVTTVTVVLVDIPSWTVCHLLTVLPHLFRWSACPLVMSTFSNVLNLFLLRTSISRSASCEQYTQYATECILSVFFPRPCLRVFSIIAMLSCLISSLCIRTVFQSANRSYITTSIQQNILIRWLELPTGMNRIQCNTLTR